MSEIQPTVLNFARYPKLAGVFGLSFAVIFSGIGVIFWNDLRHMPASPTEIRLSQLPSLISSNETLWLTIHDITWDCKNIVYTPENPGIRTEVIFTNATRSIWGVAEFAQPEKLSCQDLAADVTGITSSMGQAFFTRLSGRGFDVKEYQSATTRVYVCTFCGRDNSLGMVVLSIVLGSLSLSLYPLAIKLRQSYERRGLLAPNNH